MKHWLISDLHINHANIATYCDRPANFSEIIRKNLDAMVKENDRVICLGDVFIGKYPSWDEWRYGLKGHWILVRGNHDKHHGCEWWCNHGFDFACDGLVFHSKWLTHHPSTSLADGCELNIHGHLHNIWHGFHPNDGQATATLRRPWQRLYAIEYTNYKPVEFEEFISHPDKFFARGLNAANKQTS